MASRRLNPKIQSWIPPEYALHELKSVFSILVPTSDKYIVEFISKGEFRVNVYGSKNLMFLFKDHSSFYGQMEEAVWD